MESNLVIHSDRKQSYLSVSGPNLYSLERGFLGDRDFTIGQCDLLFCSVDICIPNRLVFWV